MSGLTPTGFEIKRLDEILDEIQTSERGAIGPQLQLGPDQTIGQLNGIIAERLALLWELALEIYSSFDPDEAQGVTLDNLAALTGVTRRAATPSTGTLTITGTPATVVPAGSQYRVPDGPIFETVDEATIGGGGTVDVAIQSVETGEIQALAGAITGIVTGVVGVSSVTNADDVVAGTDLETDEALRRRREQSLQATGTATDGAIRARVSALTTVQDARVISNRTLVTDAYGIPGKSFLTVVWPAQLDDEPVWRAIYDTMPAGILAHGAIAGTATDSQGIEQPVAYSVATVVEVHVLVEITGVGLPVDVVAQVTAAVAALSDDLEIGDDLAPYQVACAISALGLTGLTNLNVFLRVGATPTATTTYLAAIDVDIDEIAQIDSGDVTVNVS